MKNYAPKRVPFIRQFFLFWNICQLAEIEKSPNHKDSGSWHLSIFLFLGIVSPLNNIEHVFFDVKSFFRFAPNPLSCMLAIFNRVVHLLMQMFPGIGVSPTSQRRLCLDTDIACEIASRARDALLAKILFIL